MFTFSKPEQFYRLGSALFLAFAFFSAIFCGQTRVNNLFHLAALLWLAAVFTWPPLRRQLLSNRRALWGGGLTLMFLLYYSLSALWSETPGDLPSALTHSAYILLYLAWLVTLLDGERRHQLQWVMLAGIAALCLYLTLVDAPSIYHLRETTPRNPGPSNVIDLAGYAAIAILLSLMIFRDTGQKAALCFIPPLLAFMVLTQSRGPLMALVFALVATMPYRQRLGKWLWILLPGVLGVVFAVVYSAIGEMLLTRFGELYQQSFVRISIWRHSLRLIEQAPFFGYGFDKQLNFLNYTGELNHTTHSLYLGALLKGGGVGFLLLFALLAYGARLAFAHWRAGRRWEAAMFLFMLVFYSSQGMFVIANPAEFWYLFWLPLAMLLSQPKRSPIRRVRAAAPPASSPAPVPPR
ncbi:polymerase [Serratia surfactantfaciens]|uniref:O-antigen ligase family protein n=1 Tax=Serratia surfactantfaciens TaxID=2741499 RepID=UPI0007C8171C|nr:O-antigen ligase family protein [Serratia surfactantfaciens]AOF00037.1 polymerase [Serratia surfactantfaciens]